jgi:hypothetical protein
MSINDMSINDMSMNDISDSEKEYLKRQKKEMEEPIIRGYDVNENNYYDVNKNNYYYLIENETKTTYQSNLELYKKCVLNIYYINDLKNIFIYYDDDNDDEEFNKLKLNHILELIYSNDDFKCSKDVFENISKNNFMNIEEAKETITKIVRTF